MMYRKEMSRNEKAGMAMVLIKRLRNAILQSSIDTFNKERRQILVEWFGTIQEVEWFLNDVFREEDK